MHHFIDRRQNPIGKSLGNRQRFLRRARHYIKEMVDKSVMQRSIKDRSVKDLASGEKVTIPVHGIDEPRFVHSSTGGVRQRIFPGNKEFVTGDRIKRPKGGRGSGKQASEDGEGQDEFTFTLTSEEFLELLFEGLELPNLIKKNMSDSKDIRMRRAGLVNTGTPANLNLIRTMRNSLGRRLALKRPNTAEIKRIEEEISALEARDNLATGELEQLEKLRARRKNMKRKRNAISFIDPVDLRYHARTPEPVPSPKAVVFCLMDVSGSMQEREKELAKRFFLLLYLFLEQRYEHTEIVFIRHTQYALEVDENTFFYGMETGGTIVSTALEEMQDIISDRYPTNNWNIYGAQASDGENLGNDSARCEQLLNQHLMPICQHYVYIEIIEEAQEVLLNTPEDGADLWQAYRNINTAWPSFDMHRVAETSHIYPVFRKLFAKRKVE